MRSLLAGRDVREGMEMLDAHGARLGARPRGGAEVLEALDASGLRGRGGGAFPVATKWRSVANGSSRSRAVLINGAEGEPLSRKDHVLMASRPHLVLDGAAIAAETLGADDVVIYVGQAHTGARESMRRALLERPTRERQRTRFVVAPPRYVAGEESAAVHCVNDGVALPTSTPPRPFERGIAGHPTLVQNVETLAHVAMIARFGSDWFHSIGAGAPGTVLLTLSGAVGGAGVVEVPHGATVAEAVEAAGGLTETPQAVMLGGYFGGWMDARSAWPLQLDAAAMRAAGTTLGCGVVSVLGVDRCGVLETAHVTSYLADESARQCGPCVFGLRAIAEAVQRIAAGIAQPDDLSRARRWATQLGGRGACNHPDGAAAMLLSALDVFAEEFAQHEQRRGCSVVRRAVQAA
jgi:NADH:ubiquinone oxidoreductase subunit F (NADH-binding)